VLGRWRTPGETERTGLLVTSSLGLEAEAPLLGRGTRKG